MHKDVIVNRICYDRIKIRVRQYFLNIQVQDQAKHFQKLLEVKPSLNNKPPIPFKKSKQSESSNQVCTKKERTQLDKNVQIQQENRILLRKMLQIDMKPSELSKQLMKPKILQYRSLSNGKPRPSLNMYNRIEELKKISDENQIILKKIHYTKPHYNHFELEKENKERKYLVNQLSQCAGRFSKHSFFVNDGKPFNPVATFYRQIMTQSASSQKRAQSGYELFSKTMNLDMVKSYQQLPPTAPGGLRKRKIKKIKLKKKKFGNRSNSEYELQYKTLNDHFKTMELRNSKDFCNMESIQRPKLQDQHIENQNLTNNEIRPFNAKNDYIEAQQDQETPPIEKQNKELNYSLKDENYNNKVIQSIN